MANKFLTEISVEVANKDGEAPYQTLIRPNEVVVSEYSVNKYNYVDIQPTIIYFESYATGLFGSTTITGSNIHSPSVVSADVSVHGNIAWGGQQKSTTLPEPQYLLTDRIVGEDDSGNYYGCPCVEVVHEDTSFTYYFPDRGVDGYGTLALAEEHYSKSEVDGVTTGANVLPKMNEVIGYLEDYEEVTGEKLPFDFWEAVMAEFQRWQENPNEVKEWVTSQDADGNITSTNPYYFEAPTKPVVDFSVTRAAGVLNGKSSFSPNTSQIIFLPFANDIASIQSFNQTGINHVIAPNATYCYSAFRGYNISSLIGVLYLPKLTQGYALLAGCQSDIYAVLPSASSLTNAFNGTKMSAENISKTLDFLPTLTDGKSHVVTFAHSHGAAELTQESPSVAAAVAKGWTVEL